MSQVANNGDAMQDELEQPDNDITDGGSVLTAAAVLVTSVRQAARTMGLTRARVYQLLNEINDIMMVRWPNGRHQVSEIDLRDFSAFSKVQEKIVLTPVTSKGFKRSGQDGNAVVSHDFHRLLDLLERSGRNRQNVLLRFFLDVKCFEERRDFLTFQYSEVLEQRSEIRASHEITPLVV